MKTDYMDTAGTSRQQSTKQRSTLPYRPTPPGSETNRTSLHRTQGGSDSGREPRMSPMRIVQVSAHYPPNFTSGGTLVPQRIARGLAARGHDSWVYAGYLDEARTPLSTWHEVDDAGVRIRWITSTPWTAWDDTLNWDNPGVEDDFRSWLREVEPEVVHLHSLQTLGGSLVTAAKAAGAATVVTMHDFWWFCARQFLADRSLRPCSLVVDCGACECQVDSEWKIRRLRQLERHLEAADVVLAPSRSAARVLAANGVDPDRLRVDESGVPSVPTRSPAKETTDRGPRPDGVRFMFAGGRDPMKGYPVLKEAIARLPADVPWSIDIYGVPEAGDGRGPSVRGHDAFAPERLAEVLRGHDVLVLPSVVRESYSILTREALAAGLAVVCSDSLGPEEVVDHGSNGLIVPAGDSQALGGALERLVRDPAKVRDLRAGSSPPALREVADQVAGLEELYADLASSGLASPPLEADPASGLSTGGRAEHRWPRSVLFVVGINGAPLRYRAHLAAEALVGAGVGVEIRHYRDPDLPRLAQWADAIVLYRVPATVQTTDLILAVRSRTSPVPLLADLDDLIFDPGLRQEIPGLARLGPQAEALWWRGVARYRTTLEMADVFIGSTETLCNHATRVVGLPSYQFRNGVGRAMVTVSDREVASSRRRGNLRIGYFSGTTTHDADWAAVEPAVIQVMRLRPNVELWLGGPLRTTAALKPFARRVRRFPTMPWQHLVRVLRDVDVNLAPLVEGSVFNEAKSAIKWLEAAIVETPTVASPTQPFVEAIEHGRTGFLAESTEEWTAHLVRLLDDNLERARVGSQARREALLTLSPHLQARVYLAILREARDLVAAGRRERDTTWVNVMDDEPFDAAAAWVEPYSARQPRSRRVLRLLRYPAAARRVLRAAGLSGLARKLIEVTRRTVRRGLHR